MRATQIRVQSVTDVVESELREQILNEEIPMGTIVKEADVAAVFEVARPTAKAAIDRLVMTGLLRREMHKSARVPVLSADDVSDLYSSRSIVEAEVSRRLARTRSVPVDAGRHIDELRAVGPGAAPGSYVSPDIAFHRVLVRELRSPRLNRMHESLMQEMNLCMAQVQAHDLLPVRKIIAEHEAITTAIAEGNSAAAAAASLSHLDNARNALVAHLEQTAGDLGSTT